MASKSMTEQSLLCFALLCSGASVSRVAELFESGEIGRLRLMHTDSSPMQVVGTLNGYKKLIEEARNA